MELIKITCIVPRSYVYLRLIECIICLQCSPGWVRTQMGTYAATRTPDKGTQACGMNKYLFIIVHKRDSIIVGAPIFGL